jgi:hypothetical protein
MGKYSIFIILIVALFTGCRKSEYSLEGHREVLHDDGSGTGTLTFTKGNEYILEGFVFVNDGQVLTIEPGVVVRFRTGQAENASALIVSRGGKIMAEGTPNEPIIFTAEDDDLEGSVAKKTRGLWGGLIVLGNAPVNGEGGEASIEGIPWAEPRGFYGGVDENDDSGVLRFVSIRHGGTNIGDGNEINGLTLGGVGRNTTIDYVEVASNEDDGIEIFGGTVNLKHMVVSGCGDDAFDYDLGWTGNGQFWLGVQSDYLGDNLLEAGGGVNPVDGLPNSLPQIFNTTWIGNGETSAGAMAAFERNAGGVLANSVFIHKAKGISMEVTDQLHDSYNQWMNGKLAVRNTIFHRVASDTPESIFRLTGVFTEAMKNEWVNDFHIAQNEISNPEIDYSANTFVPEHKIKGELCDTPSPWFQMVDFKGAFGEDNWIEGWTLLSE